MNPLIAALLAAGVISAEEARTLNGLLNEGATRIEAEQRVAAAFATGFENQRSRLIRALDMGNVDYRDPMLPTFWAAEHDLLAREVLPTLTGIAQDVALTATVRSGGLADWRTVNEAVIQWTDTHYRSVAGDALGSIPNLDETARNLVADAVQRWQRGELNAGAGRGGLPRLIAELQTTGAFDVDRAARIAVTETTRIYAESERTAAQANPNMEYLVWQTSSDEATCLICAPMEGQRIPKGQTTFPGGYYPPAHPNCRCGVTAVTEFAAEVLSGAAVPGQVAPGAPFNAQSVKDIDLGKYVTLPGKYGLPGYDYATPVNNALGLIDNVHGVEDAPPIDFYQIPDGIKGKQGVYEAGRNRIGLAPSKYLTEQDYTDTFIHEFGHYLDHAVLGSGGDWASSSSNEFSAWRAAVDNSRAIKSLQSAPQTNFHTYLQSYEECWARSYNQYIETRNGSGNVMGRKGGNTLTWEAGIWESDDFEPIANAIDAIFSKRGWKK